MRTLENENEEHERSGAFTRRALLLGVGASALIGGLVSRMYKLQILDADKFRTMADTNRISLEVLPPPRGRIIDRNQTELAGNRPNYRVLMVPDQTPSIDAALDQVSRFVPLTQKQRDRVTHEASGKSGLAAVAVVDGLNWDVFSKINLAAPDLPGLVADVGQVRTYPFGAALSHVLGYVAAVSENDLKTRDDGDPLLRLPGFPIGKNGVEKAVDRPLRGKGGVRQVEVNAHGRVMRELGRTDGKPGADIELTLNMEIQKFAQDRMADQSASAVLLDVRTGEILSFVSSPGFDPNEFITGFTQQRWQEMNTDDYKPLLNKALAGEYPPGSTFKMMTALAALESGSITADTYISCPGYMRLGKQVFHCWRHSGHGALNVVGGLKNSCDVFFYESARRCGVDAVSAMARRFGLGQKFNFEVPGERPGNLPSEAWKMARFGEGLQAGDALNTGIGQGYVLATPLQLAVMAGRIANGGYAITPHIVRMIGAEPKAVPAADPVGVSPEHMALVQEGMNQVVNGAGGTAVHTRLRDSNIKMAGKTGTAQVRRITASERAAGIRSDAQLPWRLRNHALFVCFAPVGNPRYAMAVVVEHGQAGGKFAGPIARDIMQKAIDLDSAATPVAAATGAG